MCRRLIFTKGIEQITFLRDLHGPLFAKPSAETRGRIQHRPGYSRKASQMPFDPVGSVSRALVDGIVPNEGAVTASPISKTGRIGYASTAPSIGYR